jgi:hypothetical protein
MTVEAWTMGFFVIGDYRRYVKKRRDGVPGLSIGLLPVIPAALISVPGPGVPGILSWFPEFLSLLSSLRSPIIGGLIAAHIAGIRGHRGKKLEGKAIIPSKPIGGGGGVFIIIPVNSWGHRLGFWVVNRLA